MILPLPHQRRPSLFPDHEPVVQGQALLPEARQPGGSVPRFGDTVLWDFNGVLKRPANVRASAWKVNFSLELEDPYWNLLAREFMMLTFNQRHPAVLKRGVILDGAADPRTLNHIASHLRTAARWAREKGLSPHPDGWTVEDLRQRISDLATDGSSSATVKNHVSLLKSLAAAEPVLSLPWPAGDPWPGQSARSVARHGQGGPVTTPASAPEDHVSPTTAAALRAAMVRLFEGRPQRTDGRLTKENLYKEAQVSRATMNRAHAVLAEWDAHLAAHGKTTPGEAKRDATIADLKKRLTEKTQECTLLEKKLKAAQTAIAALFHDNQALRQQLDMDTATAVTPIRPRGPRQRC